MRQTAAPELVGADGLALDNHGNLYVANIMQDTILRISSGGDVETIADVNDGLDGPSTLAFGPGDSKELLFVNFAYPSYLAGQDPHPSLMKVTIPEPSSLLLAALGFVGLLASATQRRRT